MINPYESPKAEPPAPPETPRKPRFWRNLLIAYGVHHGFTVLGFVVGIICTVGLWTRNMFPTNPLHLLLLLVVVPLYDLYLLFDPLSSGDESYVAPISLRLLRSAGVVTVFAAGVAYAVSPRRGTFWYVAIMSLVLAISLMVSHALNSQ